MLDALEREFGDLPGTTWTRPRGGLFVWLSLPEEMAAGPGGPLIAAAIREGVLYIPGEFGHVSETGPKPTNEMRLSYGDASIEQIQEGIRRLRRAVAEVRRQGSDQMRLCADSVATPPAADASPEYAGLDPDRVR
jgi:2-aminoadipate transaminase